MKEVAMASKEGVEKAETKVFARAEMLVLIGAAEKDDGMVYLEVVALVLMSELNAAAQKVDLTDYAKADELVLCFSIKLEFFIKKGVVICF